MVSRSTERQFKPFEKLEFLLGRLGNSSMIYWYIMLKLLFSALISFLAHENWDMKAEETLKLNAFRAKNNDLDQFPRLTSRCGHQSTLYRRM